MRARVVFIIFTVVIMIFMACSDNEGPDSFEPQLIADSAKEITRNEAVLTGRVILRGSTSMPDIMFRYGKTESMDDNSGNINTEDGSVSYSLTGLLPNTTYFYCLQSSNGRSTLQSAVHKFTTKPIEKPMVGELTTVSQGPLSIIVSFQIYDTGGDGIGDAGCYCTESDNGETVKSAVDMDKVSDGLVTLRIGGLKKKTSYVIKAYASNSMGETIGREFDFTTGDAVELLEPGYLSKLMEDDWNSYENLSFSGKMNGSDVKILRRMLGKNADGTESGGRLKSLNMADVSIVAGGESYDLANFTSNDIISKGFFADCANLVNVVLPDKVTVIEKDAFKNCISLTSITIPAMTNSVSPSDGCASLKTVNVSAANKNYKSIDGVLLNADASKICWYPLGKGGEYVMPSTITEIGDNAFQGCLLSSVSLPSGLKTIGLSAFYGSSLQKVVLPENLKNVSQSAFQDCKNLSTVYIGAGTELLSEYSFDGCPIKNIYLNATVPPVCYKSAFGMSPGKILENCVLHVPVGCKNIYRSQEPWSLAGKIVEK